MDIMKLRQRLALLDRKKNLWFATRCILRVSADLAREDETAFRSNGDDIELSIVLIALSATLAASVTDIFNFGVKKTKTSDNRATSDPYSAYAANAIFASKTTNVIARNINITNTSVVNTAYHVASATANAASIVAYGVSGAAYTAKSSPGNTSISSFSNTRAAKAYAKAAAKVAASCIAIASANSASFADANNDAMVIDLMAIESGDYRIWPDLWHGQTPEDWNTKMRNFHDWLQKRGLKFWSEEWKSWVEGSFNPVKLERVLLIPPSTIKAGSQAMIAYLQADKLVQSAEARVVFLGEGEAGKTSLIRVLFGQKIRGDEKSTPRVEIRQKMERLDGNETRVHYWDFGGQVVMHATHQFFLREKSVYVVVLDIRRCDSLEYWLDHVRVFAAGAPTLIVLNKIDLLPTGMESRPSFDLAQIRRRYPFVVDMVFPISCRKKEGIDKFVSALATEISDSHIMKKDMPEQWFMAKEALARENADFISKRRFDEICLGQGITDGDCSTALKVLDALGVAIHFPTLVQNDVVLNPEWITKAIYFIVWASEKKHLDGRLDAATLIDLFEEARESGELDVEVPANKCGFLLELMAEFRLAFKSNEGEGVFRSPMLARTDEPNHGVTRKGGLQFEFSLPFLPPGLFYRFVAESGAELLEYMIWKTGVVIGQKGNMALVEYSEYLRTISFIVHGTNAGEYLTVLRQRLMAILGESYKGLQYDTRIVAPDGALLDWRETIERFARENEVARNYANGVEYNIKNQLRDYFGGDVDQIFQPLYAEIRKLFKTHKEIIVMIENNNSNINTATANSESSANSTVNVQLQHILKADSDLKMILEKIDDFRTFEQGKAAEGEREFEMTRLCREIERLRQDISELKSLPKGAEVENLPLTERIKERWDTVAELAKQCYYVTAMAPKVTQAAKWMAAFFG